MTEELSIKRKSGQLENEFDFLKENGIKYLEQLSGKVWTDFNLHDPGITILDQLCYTLTEIIYSSQFDIKDYITTDENKLPLKDFGLYPASEIFPSHTITENDYRVKLYSELPDIIDSWVQKKTLEGIEGLYEIIVEIKREHLDDKNKKIEIIEEIKKVFNENRNLCEDLYDVKILEPEYISVHAELEVSNEQNAENILAQVYFTSAVFFSSSISPATFEEELLKGVTTEELLCGPFTSCGKIYRADLRKKKSSYNVSELNSELRKVNGIKSISSIHLESLGEKHKTVLTLNDAGKCARLDFLPATKKEATITLTNRGKALKIDYIEVRRKFYKKFSDYFSARKIHQNIDELIPVKSGSPKKQGDYYSLQNHFPRIYGINEFGVPESETAARKAMAKQLKTYLLIFEQIIANTAAQKDNIHNLFSLDENIDRTYFTRMINGVPNSKTLFKIYLNPDTRLIKNTSNCLIKNAYKKEFSEFDFFKQLDNIILEAVQKNIEYLLRLYKNQYEENGDLDKLFLDEFEKYLQQWFVKNEQRLAYIMSGIDSLFFKLGGLKKVSEVDFLAELRKRWWDRPELASSKILNIKSRLLGLMHSMKEENKINEVKLTEGIIKIFQNAQPNSLSNQFLKFDKFSSRRNRYLDYMLGFYGEKFSQNTLKRFNYYYRHHEFDQEVVNNKLLFLKNIVEINRDKARAHNCTKKVWNTGNIPGALVKLNVLLGIKNIEARFFSELFHKVGFEPVSESDLAKCSDCLLGLGIDNENIDRDLIEKSFFDIPLMDDLEKLDLDALYRQVKEMQILKSRFILDTFFRYGVNLENFKIGKYRDYNKFYVVFKADKNSEWILVSTFDLYETAIRQINYLRKFLIVLNQECEGFHIVEHILLRRSGENKYTYIITDEEGKDCFKPIGAGNFEEREKQIAKLKEKICRRDAYSVIQMNEQDYNIIFRLDDNSFIKGVINYSSEEKATEAINICLKYFNNLEQNNLLENCINKIIKRSADLLIPEDYYSHRVSIVAPDWSARFNNYKFRQLVLDTVMRVFPAHIYTKVYWVNYTEMKQFEKNYRDWLEELRLGKPNDEKFAKISDELIRFFQNGKSEI